MTAPEPEKVLTFDLDEPNALDKLETLPEWIQNIIKKGITYQSLVDNPFGEEAAGEDAVGDDDLPF